MGQVLPGHQGSCVRTLKPLSPSSWGFPPSSWHVFFFHAHGNTRVRSKRHRIPPSQVSFGWRKRPAAFHLLSHACTQPQNCVIWPLSISLGVVARLSLLQLSKNPSHLTAGKGQVAGYTHTDKSLLGHSAPSLLRGMRKCNLENLPV